MFCLFFLQVARLESQVLRYKTASETAERSEEELKTERRKTQREVRERFCHQHCIEFQGVVEGERGPTSPLNIWKTKTNAFFLQTHDQGLPHWFLTVFWPSRLALGT